MFCQFSISSRFGSRNHSKRCLSTKNEGIVPSHLCEISKNEPWVSDQGPKFSLEQSFIKIDEGSRQLFPRLCELAKNYQLGFFFNYTITRHNIFDIGCWVRNSKMISQNARVCSPYSGVAIIFKCTLVNNGADNCITLPYVNNNFMAFKLPPCFQNTTPNRRHCLYALEASIFRPIRFQLFIFCSGSSYRK